MKTRQQQQKKNNSFTRTFFSHFSRIFSFVVVVVVVFRSAIPLTLDIKKQYDYYEDYATSVQYGF